VHGDLTNVVESGVGTTGNSSTEGICRAGTQKEPRDFDDGANALWTLYGKEARIHDEARIQSMATDMDGVPTFVRVSLP
jgi:hypothetical protein